MGGNRIYIQSMLNVPSTDIAGSVRQAEALGAAGCEILRAAIPDKDAVKLIPAIKEKVSIPLVADTILTIGWRWKRWRRGSIRSGSIPETSEAPTGSRR